VGWHLESTKMESASFNIFDRSQLKFQLSDPDAYYVHHMSMFEHLLHKKYGFEAASNASRAMSLAAFHGECKNETSIKAMHRGMGRDRAEYVLCSMFLLPSLVVMVSLSLSRSTTACLHSLTPPDSSLTITHTLNQ
jgi:hypothetical protein